MSATLQLQPLLSDACLFFSFLNSAGKKTQKAEADARERARLSRTLMVADGEGQGVMLGGPSLMYSVLTATLAFLRPAAEATV